MRMRNVSLMVGMAGILGGFVFAAGGSDVYVKKETWVHTLFSVRDQIRQGMDETEVILGPWYTTGGLRAGSFDTSLFPEEEINLEAKDARGRGLWQRGRYTDGQVQGLRADSAGATYLYRTITTKTAQLLPVSLGSDDGITVWLNGKKILSRDVPRGVAPDQERITLELQPGENTFLLRIYNISGDHGFYFSAGDNPLARVWNRIAQDWPQESAWMQRDLGGGSVAWLQSGNAQTTKEMVRSVVDALGNPGLKLRESLDNAGSDEESLLDLYVRACRFRQGLESLKDIDLPALRMAIEDLHVTFGRKYAKGEQYLTRLGAIEKEIQEGRKMEDLAQEALALQAEALLANPLLDFERILLVKRHAKGPSLGLPQNWQGNCALPRSGYDDEIATMPIQVDGALTTAFKPDAPQFVGDVDLHYEADKMLFSMIGSHNRWQIWEAGIDGRGLRQITPNKYDDIDNYDACYLPDERIIFASTSCFQGIPCVGGADAVANLCIMDSDGGNIRQLCFDQDHNWCPTVMNNGRVLYSRWEYSDTPHYFSRLVFSMNPDGTNQMAYYGSNSYWPNSLFYARPIPNNPVQFVGIVSGHHGVPRMGELHIFDPSLGRFEADGVIQQIPGYGKKVEAKIVDQLVDNSWPKFLHPYPLSDKYFLVAAQPTSRHLWGIYLVDVFDNMFLLKELPGYALLEPIPLRKQERPPMIPDKVDLRSKDALVYLTDIYYGPGLQDVPRGAVKTLRLFTFHYGYPNLGGHRHAAMEGSWDIHRIMGTVPVEEDGSAFFRVPANTPIAVQPLDEQGRAVQIMRSWFTAMPGEILSCVGCHEQQNSSSPTRYTQASRRSPSAIAPWRGPERGFSFKREVQPVLDQYCVGCHNGSRKEAPDFASKDRNGWGNFTPSYLALHPYVRRPGPESDYHLEKPMEYHAGTSELIQMLEKGHYGVALSDEAWDVLYTWIDLNVPDHGTWSEHTRIARNFHQRRMEMREAYALRPAQEDPENVPTITPKQVEFVMPEVPLLPQNSVRLPDWPFAREEAKMKQLQLSGQSLRRLDLGEGVTLDLVLVPAGRFVIGSQHGYADEAPIGEVRINAPFWMGTCEVTNAQFRRFRPDHSNGTIKQQNKDHTTPGYPISDPEYPAIRVSWKEAMSFCNWLSSQGLGRFTLPTEAQWEWACRGGSGSPMYYGELDTDFGKFANLADQSIKLLAVAGVNPQPIANPSPYEDWLPKEGRFNDGQRIMCHVARYEPNVWGLYDMHGNVWEWTRSSYRPYPYSETDGRNRTDNDDKRVVRGGSWQDRPKRATASFRLAYEPWQKVFNVGFRVVCPAEEMDPQSAVTLKQ
ncbi:MAG: SUMF1/EgtB/PvdO family nonheme iron enzyme [Sedimentisphaerales bacterium]|nr:SUMF1/EgtB/PvdO family nonheme iron enzyme [Sedimentisphaerales bacterium]